MTSLKIYIIYFVAFVLSGMIVLLSLTIGFNDQVISLGDVIDLLNNFNLIVILALIGLSCGIGFWTYYFGVLLYRLINPYIRKKKSMKKNEVKPSMDSESTYDWLAINLYGQFYFLAINKRSELKSMATILTIAPLLLAIACMSKFGNYEFISEWLLLFISSLILSWNSSRILVIIMSMNGLGANNTAL